MARTAKPRAAKPRAKPERPTGAAAARALAGFIGEYTPEVQRVAKGALAIMRRHFRGTHELAYDNYNALAIGWSPTGRTSDVVCSIALYPRWVNLFFLRGAGLPDPDRRLRGSGSRVRHVVLDGGAATIEEPAVRALIAAAIAAAPVAPTSTRAPALVIMSVSANRRPRRPA